MSSTSLHVRPEGSPICGIVGAASSYLSLTEVATFEDLMCVSNLRGKQGAGCIVVSEGGKKVHNIKTPGNGLDVLRMESYLKNVTNKGPQILVGHTRYPTKGGTDISNVHPHHFPGQLSGVHNGTLRKVRNQYLTGDQSDSNAFYKHVTEVGFKEALKQVDGAYAMVYVDYTTGTLNFIRNSQRPLFFALVSWGNAGRTAYWASEEGMLRFVLDRRKVKYEILELPVNELWTLNVNMRNTFEVTKNFVPFVQSVTQMYRGGVDSSEHWYESIPFSQDTNRTPFVVTPATVGPEKGSFPRNHNQPDVKYDGTQTFVVRNGILVRKGQDNKQVTLPRAVNVTEIQSEGKETSPSVVPEASSSELLVQKRLEDDAKARDNRGRFLPSVVAQQVPLSPSEQQFNKDAREAAEWRDHVEQEFDLMLARRYPDIDDDDEDNLPPVTVDQLFDNAFASKKEKIYESEYVETTKGHHLRKDKVLQKCKDGCAYCGDSVDYGPDLAWLDYAEFLCETCQTDTRAMTTMYDFYPFAEVMEEWREGKKPNLGPSPHLESYSSMDKRMMN